MPIPDGLSRQDLEGFLIARQYREEQQSISISSELYVLELIETLENFLDRLDLIHDLSDQTLERAIRVSKELAHVVSNYSRK